jgi:GTP-binding protein
VLSSAGGGLMVIHVRWALLLLTILPLSRSMRQLRLPHRWSRVGVPPCATVADWRTAGVDADSGANAEPEPAAKRYLIENKSNNVAKLMCPTREVLYQGILETASLPHVCIAGESNAGKSSLINHLLHKHSLAKASSVAGKTRSVDMMLVNERVVITDLPGLPSRDGQVTAMWEGAWKPLVFDYIRRCDSLVGMLYVHDVRWKVSSLVRDFLDEVRAAGVPVLLVLSKDDKLVTELSDPTAQGAEHALRERYMRRVRRSIGFEGVHVHYSTNSELAVSRKARRRLLRYIESMVEAGSRDKCFKLLDDIAREGRFSDM